MSDELTELHIYMIKKRILSYCWTAAFAFTSYFLDMAKTEPD